MTVPIPDGEAERLAALRAYEILDTPPEETFDRITRIAAAYLDVPTALISLVDESRQWFKSRYGLDAEETSRDVAFCAHAVMSDQVLVVGDAIKDARFVENPLVTGKPNIRFYAGAPLRTKNGLRLGTLCAIDYVPRGITELQKHVLEDMAQIVVDEMELRIAAKKAIEETTARKRIEAELRVAHGELEHRVAERTRELRTSEARLRAIIESSPGAVVIRDLAGRNLIVNKTFGDWYNVDRDKIVGKTMFDYLPPAIFDEIAAQERAVVATGKTVEAERRVTFQDGVTRDVFSQKFPIFGPDGDCIAIGTVVNDITDIKRTNIALRESERRFRDFAMTSSDYFFEMDENLRFSYFSDRFMEIAGISPQALLGKTRQETGIPDVDEEAWRRHLADLEAHRPFRNFTHPRTHPDGHTVYLSISGMPVHDAEGNFKGYRCTGTDKTSEVRAWQALAQSERKFRAVVDNLPIGVNLKDADGRFLLVNKQLASWYGVDERDLIGKKDGEVLDDPEPARAKRAQSEREALEKRTSVTYEAEKRRADGRMHYVVINKFPVFGDDGDLIAFGAASTDITERKHAEEDRHKALIQAEEANQAKSEFLATISHELRTPLNAILGFAEILGHQIFGPSDADKHREYANNILVSGRHLLDLVNDLLDISRIEAGKYYLSKEPLNVRTLIDSCYQVVVRRAEDAGVVLRKRCSKTSYPLVADERAMKQILFNLLTNSIKFTPRGGKVTVSASCNDKVHTIKVTDTGVGISEERLHKLTHPFEKGRSDPYVTEAGAGLGLAITKSLVELHGGALDIASAVGRGTTVTVILPNETS